MRDIVNISFCRYVKNIFDPVFRDQDTYVQVQVTWPQCVRLGQQLYLPRIRAALEFCGR